MNNWLPERHEARGGGGGSSQRGNVPANMAACGRRPLLFVTEAGSHDLRQDRSEEERGQAVWGWGVLERGVQMRERYKSWTPLCVCVWEVAGRKREGGGIRGVERERGEEE